MGTQAAVLAGFTVTGLIEFNMPPATHKLLKLCYYLCVVTALGMNLSCVSSTTALSVFGTSLALRGPDGSMSRAVDGMYQERNQVFATFGVGLLSTICAASFAAVIVMDWGTAIACVSILVFCGHRIYQQGKRIFAKFRFEEDDSVSFDDILSAPLVNVFTSAVRSPKSRDTAERQSLV